MRISEKTQQNRDMRFFLWIFKILCLVNPRYGKTQKIEKSHSTRRSSDLKGAFRVTESSLQDRKGAFRILWSFIKNLIFWFVKFSQLSSFLIFSFYSTHLYHGQGNWPFFQISLIETIHSNTQEICFIIFSCSYIICK